MPGGEAKVQLLVLSDLGTQHGNEHGNDQYVILALREPCVSVLDYASRINDFFSWWALGS